MVENSGNTVEQNMALISKHEDVSDKMTQYRDEIYEGWVAEHSDQAGRKEEILLPLLVLWGLFSRGWHR